MEDINKIASDWSKKPNKSNWYKYLYWKSSNIFKYMESQTSRTPHTGRWRVQPAGTSDEVNWKAITSSAYFTDLYYIRYFIFNVVIIINHDYHYDYDYDYPPVMKKLKLNV